MRALLGSAAVFVLPEFPFAESVFYGLLAACAVMAIACVLLWRWNRRLEARLRRAHRRGPGTDEAALRDRAN